MDISKYDKADVLRVLYNKARTQGMGILHYTSEDMTRDKAQELLDSGMTYFDYVGGRVMKVSLKNENLNTALYNRDNGVDAAERAIATLDTE